MFWKLLENGKYRYFEKYFDENQNKWKQVTVTMNSKSRVSQSEAKNRLSQKIEKNLLKGKESSEGSYQEFSTINEIFQEWRLVRDIELKDSSSHVEKKAFSKFLAAFGDFKIVEIKPKDIQNFLLQSNLSPVTRTLRKAHFNLFFRYATTVGYISENPVDKVVLPRINKTLSDVQRKQNKFLNKEEMKLILNFSFKNKRHLRKTYLYEFLFLTGLRIGEALALRWEDIDTDTSSLTVNHTLDVHSACTRDRKITSPKTIQSYRTIYLSDRCIEILNYFSNNKKDLEFIFVNEYGRIFNMSTLSHYFKEICASCLGGETGEKKYTLHMLRHSHISLLMEMNIPLKAIMDRVGHSNEKMILQVYSHTTTEIQKSMEKKIKGLTV